MKRADRFLYPMAFTGKYPDIWAGYTFLQETAQGAFHPGIDWNFLWGEMDYGKPVQAVANGIVVHRSKQLGIGYGTIVVGKHVLTDELYEFVKKRYNIDSRNLYSFYAHLKDWNVNVGDEINAGDLIGSVGKSGTGASHLHQELYKPIPGTQWRYWPTLAKGWDKNRLKGYYIDTYDFINNQPSTGGGEESMDKKITEQSDAFIAIAGKLGTAANKDIILAELDKLLQIEDALKNKQRDLDLKEEQLDEVRIEADKFAEQVKKLEKENEKITKENKTFKDRLETNENRTKDQGIKIQQLSDQIEKLQQVKAINDKGAIEIILYGIQKFFSRG